MNYQLHLKFSKCLQQLFNKMCCILIYICLHLRGRSDKKKKNLEKWRFFFTLSVKYILCGGDNLLIRLNFQPW